MPKKKTMKKTGTMLLAGCLLAAGPAMPPLQAQDFTFTTIAGGTQGSLDGVNSNAQFFNPAGVAVDGAGNVYVADQENNLIREISPQGTNWIVTTIAGGAQGSLDGTNTSAQFSSPTGIAMDNATNLYVADQFNYTVRKITQAGTNWVVSTIAGQAGVFGADDGTNTGAQFHNPTGVAADNAGNIFVADEFNNAIRKITPAGTNWIVTTIAGGTLGAADGTNTAAQFFYPTGVAVDANDHVFVAGQINNAIRLIIPVATNWVVTTIAGQSISGFSNGLGGNARFDSPVGVAVDSNDHVYVADLFNEAIRELAPSGTNWEVSTIGGGSLGTNDGTGPNASFDLPFGVAVDAYGDVFVADFKNNAIRMGISTNSPAPTGSLEVMLSPAGAISAGAQWQLDGGPSFQTNGTILSGLAPGDHVITFSNIDGFTTPAMQSVPVTVRQTTLVTANYATIIPNDGSLQVMISPSGAVDAGALWQVGDSAWQTNGGIVAGLPAGSYTLSFTNIFGWTTPSSEIVTITSNQTTPAAGTYVLQTGSLQVSILPSTVTNLGALWQVDNGAWQTNGEIIANLSVGTHTLSFFNPISGWTAPANQIVAISNNQTTLAAGTYLLQTGSLQVTILPSNAVDAGAQWQVDSNGAWQSNEGTVAGLAVGIHILSFTSISGWTTPLSQTVAISNNQTTLAAGTYLLQTGSLQVTILPSNAIDAGAQWQVDSNGAWQSNEGIVAGLSVGAHILSFTNISGWTTPSNQTVTISNSQTNLTAGTYVLQTGSLQVMLSPSGAVNAGAQWQVDGGASQSSGVTMSNLPAGNHTLSFTPIFKWNTPVNQIIMSTNGAAMSAAGVYTPFAPAGAGLVLVTNGDGIIKHGTWPALLVIGKKYTVTGAPKPGNVLSNWAGGTNLPYSLQNSSASCTFTMQSNMVLEASFVTNVFLAAQGAYTGLFAPANSARQQAVSGSFSFKVTSSGTVSGKLALGGQTVPLSGKFGLGGAVNIVSARPHGEPSLTTILQLDFTNQSVSGTVSNSAFTAELDGDRAVFTSSHPASEFEGQYTLVIPGTNDPAAGPFGASYGTVKVDGSGTITLAGSLADGTAISQSGAVSKDGYWPVYVNLYGGQGSLWGWSYFTNHTLTAASALSWINATNSSRTAMYRSGFTNQQAALSGGLYVPSFTLPEDLTVALVGGNLPFAITITNFSGNTNHLVLKTNKTTGVISGSFANPANPKQTIKVNGVILQGQTNAQGYFPGTDQSGVFTLGPP
jgi:hypothetical protein